MKIRTILAFTAGLLLIGCEQNDDINDLIDFGKENVLVLCEGNFNANNASLWSFTLGNDDISGPIYQNLTGQELGDVAQSFVLSGDRLYIVNNNSHTLEIINLGSPLTFDGTLVLPNASPRYMAINNNYGYITCWNLEGILIVDLDNQTVIDTIAVGALPEDILIVNDYLYTSIIMDSDWSRADCVLKISLTSGSVVDTFQVIPGPGRLLVNNGLLYIASNSYVSTDGTQYEMHAGTSTIDLQSGSINTNDYGATSQVGTDLVEVNGVPFRATISGIVPLNTDLSLDLENQVGNFSGVYSVGSYQDHLFFGLTDYAAPDQVIVTDLLGNELNTYEVGALPTDFAVALLPDN